MRCPLCLSEWVIVLNTVPVCKLKENWRSQFGIDIRRELTGFEEVVLYGCQECDLQFFPSELAGSGQLYAQLERFDWYYMPNKWEHNAAIQDILRGSRVLEVGCGQGDFLERLINEKEVDAVGIELNPKAVAEAYRLGRPVYAKSLEEIAEKQANTFDVVCNFQVLEHAPDPRGFISACTKLLKGGGCLIIAVPNNESFIRLDNNNLLNQPPHHITRWSRATLEALPRYFPLELLKVRYEPLADYHLEWYVNLQLRRLLRIRLLTGFVYRVVRILILPLWRKTGRYRFLRGHTIYVCYRKMENLC